MEDNLRFAYLVMVDASNNNNKFYEMLEQSDGTINLFNGRVESTRITQKPKPSSNWDKIYNSKIKKGYSDMSKFRSVSVSKKTDSKYTAIKDSKIEAIITKLQAFAGQAVSANYSIKATSVTQIMIDEAQSVVNDISAKLKKKADIGYLNDKLQYLFSVIPRKMGKVQNYLFEPLSDKDAIGVAKEMMASEQDILDSMAGQVIQNVNVTDTDEAKVKNDLTVLDSLGLKMDNAKQAEVDLIKSKMFDYNGKTNRGSDILNVFKVFNKETETAFQKNLKAAKNKNTMLMYHGSRNQNWMFILPQGLKIRPSNAIHQGSMFGDALYGADANGVRTPAGNPNPGYSKAYGYTSSSSAYWTGGSSNSNTVYMAIMEFHVGNQKHIYVHDSSCYNLNKNGLNKKGFDSVYAHGRKDGGSGGSLQNSEFMIYGSNQVTIRYLLELKA